MNITNISGAYFATAQLMNRLSVWTNFYLDEAEMPIEGKTNIMCLVPYMGKMAIFQ